MIQISGAALLAVFLESFTKGFGGELGRGFGTAIVQSIFGDQQQVSLRVLVKEYARVAAKLLRHELETHTLERLIAQLGQVQDGIGDIYSSPDAHCNQANFVLLNHSVTGAIHQANSLGVAGYSAFIVAVMTRMALYKVLNEKCKLSDGTLPGNDLANYIDMAERLRGSANGWLKSRVRVSTWSSSGGSPRCAQAFSQLWVNGEMVKETWAGPGPDTPYGDCKALEAAAFKKIEPRYLVEKYNHLNRLVHGSIGLSLKKEYEELIASKYTNMEPWDALEQAFIELKKMQPTQIDEQSSAVA